MTRILLIRSAWHELMATAVAGRSDASELLPQGKLQAIGIASRLEKLGVSQLQSSPRLRARETAEPSATRLRLEVEIVPALDDMDFGLWTDMRLSELERDRGWCAWNADRETLSPPGGESMRDMQWRVMAHLATVFRVCEGETVAMFTHAVPIRAAILDEHGLPLNAHTRVIVEPAQIFELGMAASPQLHSAVA